jgi:hypothetical protein
LYVVQPTVVEARVFDRGDPRRRQFAVGTDEE